MRSFLSTVDFNGTVVIGEGEKDEAPMLFNGEQVGDGRGPASDVAVDPIDGTRLTALGMNNALAVIAVADGGSMFDPSAVFYMDKLVVGPEAADMVDLRLPVKQNIHLVAKAKGVKPNQVTVCVLDRPRHQGLVEEIRATGARTRMILDGDVAARDRRGLRDAHQFERQVAVRCISRAAVLGVLCHVVPHLRVSVRLTTTWARAPPRLPPAYPRACPVGRVRAGTAQWRT